jgi:RimJ/RimL family protein N-acetyltransferase
VILIGERPISRAFCSRVTAHDWAVTEIAGDGPRAGARLEPVLSDHWPLFGLRVRTPRVELRYPCDDDLDALASLTSERIHDDDTMPFVHPWTRVESPERERNALRHWWLLRAQLQPDDWKLPFLVLADGEPVGVQLVMSTSFGVARSVKTGSWLVQRRQGEGIGTEMRAAVLHLAFAGLGAEAAHTSAFADNPASLAVTRALGYRDNGEQVDDREGKPARHFNFVMARVDWEARRRDDITIDGLEPCRALLGA